MKQNVIKVTISLVILIIVAIIIAIFALRGSDGDDIYTEQYEENIRVLNDSIKVLREDIAKYKVEVDKLNLEREKIKQELELILKDNEKVDTELANGDWDTNIKFLSDFLSKKGTDRE